ncbi:MAG TPA: hypothetical protein VLQ93_14745, partial [Myxococcaceae bacterium]|nr:hypothetical protein [Myxococcaceae bacterium]
PSRRVAEGGMLRLFFQARGQEPLEVAASIEGQPLARTVPLALHAGTSPEGQAVRRGFYERQLAAWMGAWRRSPDADLKQLIIETSLRENIPTAFTALQVSSPELSLDAVKPGDPLLTVRDEPGLEEVVAWYPFGEVRRLAHEPREGAWYDRFLVPRGWTDRYYAVQVFKRYASGEVRREQAWYRLDDVGPEVSVRADEAAGVLHVVPVDGNQDVAAVRLEGEGGWARTLSPLAGEWKASLAELPRAFTVVVRDRAGNASHMGFTWEGGTLRPAREERGEVAPAPALAREVPALDMQGRGLRLAGEDVELELEGRVLRFAHVQAPLGSLTVGAVLRLDEASVLLGTEAGDLVRLDCAEGAERCTARTLATFPHHPVTGLVRLDAERVLVGVLGEGLKELRGETLERSGLEVGSAFVTGLAVAGRDVLVGTAYNGLWRVVGGNRTVRTRFPHAHVQELVAGREGVEVRSGHGRFLQRGRDSYRELPAVTPRVGSSAMMAAVRFEGEVYVGGFDSGLWRWTEGRLERVEVALGRREAQVNALASFGGALWTGTEAGLLRLTREGGEWKVERLAEGSVHDLAVGPEGLAVATSRGLLLADEEGGWRRIDVQSGVEAGRFFAVAWQGDALYAGGMDGLYRFQGGRGVQVGAAEGYHGGWVTALLAHEGRLLVGTYARGVYTVEDGRAEPVAGLEAQWVPLRALKVAGGSVWVGGLGMPSVRLDGEGSATAVHLPTRDVNDFLEVADGVLLLTTDGPVLLPQARGAYSPLAVRGRH